MEENPSTLTNASIFIKYIFCPPSLKARDDTVDSESLVKIWQESIPALAQTNLPCGKVNVHFSFTTSTLSLSGNPSWWCDKRGTSSHPGAKRLLWPTDGQASTGHRSTNSTLLCAMSVSNNVTHSGVPSPCISVGRSKLRTRCLAWMQVYEIAFCTFSKLDLYKHIP